jgi:hypothetical protein
MQRRREKNTVLFKRESQGILNVYLEKQNKGGKK